MISDNHFSTSFPQVKIDNDLTRDASQLNTSELDAILDAADIKWDIWRGASVNPNLASGTIDMMLEVLHHLFKFKPSNHLVEKYTTNSVIHQIIYELFAHPNLSSAKINEMLLRGLWCHAYGPDGVNAVVLNPQLSGEQCIRFFDKFISPAYGFISMNPPWFTHFMATALLWFKTVPHDDWMEWSEVCWIYFKKSRWQLISIMLKSPHFNPHSCTVTMDWIEALPQVEPANFGTLVELLDSSSNDPDRTNMVRQMMFRKTDHEIFVKKEAAEIFVF